MKVSKSWLNELVDLNTSLGEVVKMLPLKAISTKEVNDQFIELDMKGYNRSDLLSLRGVAYEIAAITDSKVTFSEPQESEFIWNKEKYSDLSVEVKNPELTPIYCLVKIEGLKVEKSSTEWIKKLEDSGYRSVNNIADMTNLIMLEYGQPLHSFDAAKVKGEKIIVRNAKDGEKVVTLDNKERELKAEDILITDEENILGIAGVMGSKASEVTEKTTSILLEAAIFDPASLRRTSTRLNLTSEASKRFYHGLTKKRLFQALNEAISAYTALGGKVTGFTVVGDYTDKESVVTLREEKINSLIGIDLAPEQVEEHLNKLHFKVGSPLRSNNNSTTWEVMAPYFRQDIEIEEDLIEEVARMYGYEKIPSIPLAGELPEKIDQKQFEVIKKLREVLVKTGLTEVQTYSFYSTRTLAALGWTPDLLENHMVKIKNPLSSETEYMRQNIWPNLTEVIDKNIRQGFEDIAIFEIGKIYYPNTDGKPEETYRLGIALMNSTDNPLLELSKIVNKASQELDLELKINLAPATDGHRLFHPVRHASVLLNDAPIGGIAEVHPRVLDSYGVSKRVAILEIDLTPLFK